MILLIIVAHLSDIKSPLIRMEVFIYVNTF